MTDVPRASVPDPLPPVLVVPRRFRGPSASGNGGWTAGALAAYLPGAPAVRVRLHRPPPLESPMAVSVELAEGSAGRRCATARTGAGTVLEATEVDDDLEAVPAVSFATAREAVVRYGGRTDHPFPECFACGTGRAAGDGLRLAPGRVDEWDDAPTAAAWVPDASLAGQDGVVPAAVVWAALDCPGGWSVDLAGRPMVLGTITTALTRAPLVGEQCVVTSTCRAVKGRKATTSSTLHGADGAVLARASAVWIAVDPASVQP